MRYNLYRVLSYKYLYLCTAFRRQTIPPRGGVLCKIYLTKKALLGGGHVWLERRSPLLLPFEVPSQGTSPSRFNGRTFRAANKYRRISLAAKFSGHTRTGTSSMRRDRKSHTVSVRQIKEDLQPQKQLPEEIMGVAIPK